MRSLMLLNVRFSTMPKAGEHESPLQAVLEIREQRF